MKFLKEHDRYHQIDYHDALRRASYAGQLNSVKYLIESKMADIHFDEDIALRSAAGNNQFDVVRYLIEVGADILPREDGAMGPAGRNGHLDVLKYLTDRKGRIPEGSDYALAYASESGHLEAVDYLLGIGVDVHSLNELALKSAVIEAGADVHQGNDEVIFLAVINNRYNILNFFQEIGYPIKGSLKRAAKWESIFILNKEKV